MIKHLLVIVLALSISHFSRAQGTEQSTSDEGNKFVLTGSANVDFMMDAESFDQGLIGVGWLPIFLWKPSDKLFFESHLHIEVEAESGIVSEGGDGHAHGGGDEPEEGGHADEGAAPMVMLGYADLVYIVNDYMTLTGGIFASPFGTFQERFHPAWINKLPNPPLGFGHHNPIAPSTEMGVQLRGGIPFGGMKMNYSIFVSNGPTLLTSEEQAGKLSFSNYADNNRNKAVGGRIGWLPLSNSSLEIGASILTGNVGSDNTEYEGVGATLLSGDFSYFRSYSGFGDINVKAQWILSSVDEAHFPMDSTRVISGSDTTYQTEFTFDNQSESWYAQISYRPSKSETKFIRNLEFVARYDAFSMPEEAPWEESDSRISFGIDYWLKARSAIKVAYQLGERGNALITQFVIGF